MEKLTDRELRRVRLAGKIARGLRYFLYLIMAGLVVLIGAGLYIHFTGGGG